MEIGIEIIAAIISSTLAGAVLITITIIKWLDRRITEVERNISQKTNGVLTEYIEKADRRYKRMYRRQNKLEKVVYSFIDEIKKERYV